MSTKIETLKCQVSCKMRCIESPQSLVNLKADVKLYHSVVHFKFYQITDLNTLELINKNI